MGPLRMSRWISRVARRSHARSGERARPLHSVSVIGVVVSEQGLVLLQRRRDNGAWEPPGGVLELGERIVEGLLREVKEETGLEVAAICLTGIYKSMSHSVVELAFSCRAVGGALAPSEESADFVWATPERVAELTTEAFTARVLDALAFDGRPAVREHDGFRLL
jgi:ADP-ribose pyrophosphatase YjhB (NUDIX family)